MNENHYEFNLISLRNAKAVDSDLVNKSFKFWKAMWREFFVLKELKPPKWEDEFYRHDYLALLTYKERIIGFHLYGLQNLEVNPCRDGSYMSSNFNEEFIERLKSENFPKAMSINWLTIDILFSKNNKAYSVIDLMGGLAMHSCEHLEYDVLIAAIRNDIPLAKKSVARGGVKVGENLVYNTPCDMIYIVKDSHHHFPLKTQDFTKQLWETSKNNQSTKKKAA